MADNETKINLQTEIDVQIKNQKKLDELNDTFEELNNLINKNLKDIKTLEDAIKRLSQKKNSKNFESNMSSLTSSLKSSKDDLAFNREYADLTKSDIENQKKIIEEQEKKINSIKENIAAEEENTKATNEDTKQKNRGRKSKQDNEKAEQENTEETKKDTNAKKKSAKTEEQINDDKKKEARKQKEADAAYIRAQASLTRAQNDAYKNLKRSPLYQAGRGLTQSGIYLGNAISKPIGNMLSTGFELAGSALSNPAASVAVGITQLTKAIVELGKASTKAYGEIESIRTQLGVVYGNQTQADAAFSQLSQYATKSPFGVQQTAEIATLLKQSGVEQTQIMNTLKMLGDTAGGNMEKMKRIANNYAQIISIGKASMLDMRQFAYAGIPIFEKVAEELQVSQTSLRKMISDGKVTADVIETVFKKMTDAGGLFYGATSKGAETLKARLQNLKDIKTLALSSYGERLYRVGETTGGDSIAYRAIDFAEDFYTKLNERTSLKNIEKSVITIAENNNRQKELEETIKFAEENGVEKKVIEELKNELKKLQNYTNPDKIRSNYAKLFEIYRGNERVDFSKDYLISKGSENIGWQESLTTGYNIEEFTRLNEELAAGLITEKEFDETIEKLQQFNFTQQKIFDEENALNNERLEILEAQKKITREMRLAFKETQIINAQQEQIDNITSISGRASSDINNLSKMNEFYSNTEAAKQKEQNDLMSSLKESEKRLQEIAGYTKDGSSIIDFKTVAGKKLQDYIEKGTVQARKLATTKDQEGALGDWKILKQNVNVAYKAASDYAKNYGSETLNNQAKNILDRISTNKFTNTGSVELFYNRFNNNFWDAYNNVIEKVLTTTDDDVRNFWNTILNTLKQSLLEYSSPGSASAGWETGVDKNGRIFEPLWKRVISQYTGIPTTAISGESGTGVKDALDFYSKNLSTRSIAGNVLSSMVKEGLSIDTLQRLTGYRTGTITTQGTNTPTWQIDWPKTREEMSKFVSALSTSTTAIDTWTSGLEQERNTYAELIGAGVLSAEQNNTGKAMYISARKIDEKWLSKDDFGINAFGDKLVNEDGEVVTAIRDGIAYGKDKDNKEYQLTNQNLMVTENIYNEVKEKLDSIDKELKEARKTQSYNNILSGMQGNVLNDLIIKSAAAGRGYELTNLINSNTDEYRNILEQNLDITGFKNISEFYSAYLTGDNSAISRFNEALEKTNQEVLSFVNEDLFRTLKTLNDSADKTKALNNAYNNYQTYLSGNNKSPADTGYEASLMSKFGMGGVSVKELSEYVAGQTPAGKALEEITRNGGGNTEIASRLREELRLSEQLTEQKIKEAIATQEISSAYDEMKKSLKEIAKNTAKESFLTPFKTLGEDTIEMANGTKDWSNYLSDAGNSLKDIAGQMLSNMGTEMATAGFRIAAAGALSSNWGKVAAGLSLAAAGGVSSGLGSALNNASHEEDKTSKEIEKLENIKGQLQDILEQARTDALYYENNLRHKTALGINERYSYKKVNDAIITPNGVVNTHPEDYIIATKQPQNFMNGGTSIKINQIVNNNTGVKVTQTQRTNADGSIDLITTLDEAIGNYIASEKGDEAFNVREARLRGRTAIM